MPRRECCRTTLDKRKIVGGAIALSISILSSSLGLRSPSIILVVVIAVWIGSDIFKSGIRSVLRRRPNIDLLVSVAAVGAILTEHPLEGAAVIYLFFLAESLEEYAVFKAEDSLLSLAELVPERTTVKRGDSERNVPVEEVKVGEVIIVRPGERIPLDGIVVSGTSQVNQAPITGESISVTKRRGDRVFAGSLNEDGYLEIKVDKPQEESLISKISELVRKSLERKSKTESFIERFSGYYTPLVVSIAVLISIVPPLLLGEPLGDWVYRGLIMLVIACPCALAISTPVSIVSAVTSAARNGVLLRGGKPIEEVSRSKVIAFDKTGTLTKGELAVTDVLHLNGSDMEELLSIATSLGRSKHPISKAISKYSSNRGIEPREIEELKLVPGRGVIGKLDGRKYYLGNRELFEDMGIEIPREIDELENEGKTIAILGTSSKIIGVIALRDELRDESHELIKELRRMGFRTVMLTGDNERVARAISGELEMDFLANLLPEDKVKAIERLSEEGVIMVGDGINDAPALARANVGIAMGDGADVALEVSDVSLIQNDLSKIPYVIRLGERTMGIIKQNVFSSIIVKGAIAVLAALGEITLWLAVTLGDLGLSLAVILNAMRIARTKPQEKKEEDKG